MARDPETLSHVEWLGYVQPVGLVVSIPALLSAQAHIATSSFTMTKAKITTHRRLTTRSASSAPVLPPDRLLGDIRSLIESAREQTARAVNSALVGLYWHIGKRIREDVLQEKRAGYGEEIVQTLSAQLTAEYGRGFDRRNLFHLIRFAEVFPDEQMVNALRTQLSSTHFRELLPIDDQLKRDFYAEMCRMERWSTRTLADRDAQNAAACRATGPTRPARNHPLHQLSVYAERIQRVASASGLALMRGDIYEDNSPDKLQGGKNSLDWLWASAVDSVIDQEYGERVVR